MGLKQEKLFASETHSDNYVVNANGIILNSNSWINAILNTLLLNN